MIATNIANGEKVILKKGNIAKSVMASTCVPGIFVPIEIDNEMLVDGGIVENVPVKTLKQMGAEFIIGVDLNPVHSYGKPSNIIDIILNSFHYSIKQTVAMQTNNCDILFKPDLSQYSLSSTKNMQDLITKGYDHAIKVLDSLNL